MECRSILKVFALLLAITVTSQSDAETQTHPIIKSLSIHSKIKFTYAKTSVFSRILNPSDSAQEVNFRVVLPEEAFITGLVMTIKNQSYDAYVKGKEDAKKEYDAAVSAGQGAAHVSQDSRFSKDFTVSVNVEAHGKVNFNLTYEELLSRKNRTYKNEINVNPNQIVDGLSIIVDIEDTLNIQNVQIPAFKTTNTIDLDESENPSAKKSVITPNKVRVEWNPSVKEQKELNKDGLNGKMVVKYDVDAKNNPQQILVDSDGYFVHILRNDNLPVLDKHVVFVLDVSGSMAGNKMNQLKHAMHKILLDLSQSDWFSIVLFSVKVIAWGPNVGTNLTKLHGYDDSEPANVIANDDYVIPATKANLDKALKFIDSLDSYGGTNIMGGIRNGLKLAKLGKKLHTNSAIPRESMVIFLTDGQPNSEESNADKIVENVQNLNNGVSIFSLGFGYDADTKFLKKLSLANSAFARTIYEDSDASLQLQNFYKEVASPVLSDVKFEYLPDQVENTTSDNFKNLFSGSDLLVLGKVKNQGAISGALTAQSHSGPKRFNIPIDVIIVLPPIVKENKTLGYLQKMWAYKTIKSLLDKNTLSKNDTIENKAKELSLKYSFVTPLTSLVVVKPNDSSLVNDEESKGNRYGGPYYLSTPFNSGFGAAAGAPAAGFAGVPIYSRVPSYMPSGSRGGYGGGGGFSMRKHIGIRGPVMQGYGGRPAALPPAPMYPTSMQTIYPSTTVSSPMYVLTNYSQVSWLNQTDLENGIYLNVPLSLNTTDVIALNETDTVSNYCPSGDPCKHFIYCTLDVFKNDVQQFMPFQCHIDPKYLGVCCPQTITN